MYVSTDGNSYVLLAVRDPFKSLPRQGHPLGRLSQQKDLIAPGMIKQTDL